MTSRSFMLRAGFASSVFVLLAFLAPSLQAQAVGIAVVNAASFAAQFPVAPGSLVSGFAVNPANQSAQIFAGAPTGESAAGIPLPTTIRGVQVLVNNVASPLLFARRGNLGVNPPIAGQVNFQIPAATPEGKHTVRVVVDGTEVAAGSVNVFNIGPGLFFNGADPVFPGIVQNFPSFQLNDATNRTARGGVVIAYGTGQGPVDMAVADGNAPPAGTTVNATSAAKCFVGVEEVTPGFSGLTAGFVGLWQLNIPIPDVPSVSGRMPLFCTSGGISTNVVSIWVAE